MTTHSTPTLNPHGAFASAEAYARYTGTAIAPFDERQIEDCRAWLSAWASPPKQRFVKGAGAGSYRLKHEVERWLRTSVRADGPDCYITNGAFIAAAALEGYKYRLRGEGPNCEFNFAVRRGRRKRKTLR